MFRCFVRRWINFLEALLYYWTKFLKITLSSLSLSFLTRKNMDWNWNRTRRKEEESILLFDYLESFFHGYPIFIARPRDRIKDARGKYIPSSPSSKLAKVAVLVFFFAPRRVVCRPLDMKRAMEARKLRTSPSPPSPRQRVRHWLLYEFKGFWTNLERVVFAPLLPEKDQISIHLCRRK